MQLSLLIITAFAAFTSAVNIHGFPAYGCGGQRWSCLNIASGTCCKFRVNIRSVYWSLPARGGGFAYPGLSCAGAVYTPIPLGPINLCGSYGGSPVRSARWVAGLSTRHVARAESQLEAREDSVDASVFTFIYKGETTVLNVPEGSVEEVIDLAAKEDYEGLKGLSKGWQSISESPDLDLPPAENVDYTLVQG